MKEMTLNLGSYGGGRITTGGGYNGSGYGQVVTASRVRQMSNNTAAGYEAQMEIIDKYMKNGETDKALKMYQELFDDVKASNTYGNMTINDSQVATILSNSYANATGSNIVDSIDKNTAGSFWSGMVQGIPLVGIFCNDTTEAEAMAKLTNDKVSAKDKIKEYLGAATPGLAALGVAGIAGIAATTAPAWAVPVAIGGAICAGVGLLQTALKDIF